MKYYILDKVVKICEYLLENIIFQCISDSHKFCYSVLKKPKVDYI